MSSPGAIVLQYPVQVLYTSSVAPAVFVTQQVIEVAANWNPSARVSQQGLEVLRSLAQIKTHTITTALKKTETLTHTASFYGLKTSTKPHGADTFSVHTRSLAHSVDTKVVRTSTAYHYAQAGVVFTHQLAHTAAFLLVETTAKTHYATSLSVHTQQVVHSTSASLKKTTPVSHSADTRTKLVPTLVHFASSMSVLTSMLQHAADYLLLQISTRSHGAGYLVRQTSTASHMASVAVENFQLSTHYAGFFLIAHPTVDHLADASVVLTSMMGHYADMAVYQRGAKHHSADSLLKLVGQTVHFVVPYSVHTRLVSAHADTLALYVSTKIHTADFLLLGSYTRQHLADTKLYATKIVKHMADLSAEPWRSTSHFADTLQIASSQLGHSADVMLFEPNVAVTPQTYRFTYVDDYGTIYTVTWDTTKDQIGNEILDISTYTEQPFVWGQPGGEVGPYDESLASQDAPSPGYISGRELYRRGIITLQRQVIETSHNNTGYTITQEGASQYVGYILSSFNCNREPVDPFKYHLAANTVDDAELPVTQGSCFTGPDDSLEVVWSDLDENGEPLTDTGAISFEWDDVWTND